MVDNTVTIVGTLTADPEVRVTDGGATLANIRFVQNKRTRTPEGEWVDGDPMYFEGTVWRSMAENAAASLTKGMRVIVVGKLNYQAWEDKETQQNRSKIVIAIDEIAPSLLWSKETMEKTYGGPSSSAAPVARENYEEDEAPF